MDRCVYSCTFARYFRRLIARFCDDKPEIYQRIFGHAVVCPKRVTRVCDEKLAYEYQSRIIKMRDKMEISRLQIANVSRMFLYEENGQEENGHRVAFFPSLPFSLVESARNEIFERPNYRDYTRFFWLTVAQKSSRADYKH